MEFDLSSTPLFRGISKSELSALLTHPGTVRKNYKKGAVIFAEGSVIEHVGIVLSGKVLIQYSDVWGTASILGRAGSGEVFGEAYACCSGVPLQISAVAAVDTTVLFLNVNRLLEPGSSALPFQAVLVRNLLTVCAQKNLGLSRRMLHTTPKTIRARLLSYFSECVKTNRSLSFTLPYNRQQLADYLGVDRSALCSELSKMQKDGLIRYHLSRIEICAQEELPVL